MQGPILIAVAGVVGVGKTTLAEKLAGRMGGELVREEYERNSFLDCARAGDMEAALPAELDFLLSRARQLARLGRADDALIITDYIFEKNHIFAQLNLNARELALYEQVEESLRKYLLRPRVVVYLRDTPGRCRERIVRRGRSSEQAIRISWLERLDRAYEDLWSTWRSCAVVRVNCECEDVRDDDVVEEIIGRISAVVPAAMRRVEVLSGRSVMEQAMTGS